MTLQAGCPRCEADGRADGDRWVCSVHGSLPTLHSAAAASYADLVSALSQTAAFPLYLPWPFDAGWWLERVGVVSADGVALASVTQVVGTSSSDGVVQLTCLTEEVGVGLSARIVGIDRADPAPQLGSGTPTAHVCVHGPRGEHTVALWPVEDPAEADRSILVGEADGRWLWLTVSPAPSVLMLTEGLTLRDAADLGPALLHLGYSG